MTSSTSSHVPDETERAENVTRLKNYLDENSMTWQEFGSKLLFSLPDGRDARFVAVDEFEADIVADGNLSEWRFVANHEALSDEKRAFVEVALTHQDFSDQSAANIWDVAAAIGGAPLSNGLNTEPGARHSRQELIADLLRVPLGWEVVVERDGLRIEISPYSEFFHALVAPQVGGFISAKITQIGAPLIGAEDLISGVLTDLLLELNFVYGLNLWLQPRARVAGRAHSIAPSRAIRFPANIYSSHAKSLYAHGNSATEFPLLRYLSYYQVLEHFFQQFNREEVIRSLSRLLRDPAFDLERQEDVLRVIEASADAHLGRSQELAQLSGTLEAMVSSSEVAQWISSSGYLQYFTERRQRINGLSKVDPLSDRLLDEVAKRVYAIRNRIVHTKDAVDGADSNVILPSGREVFEMTPEIELLKYLAQRALIHGARRR